MHGTTLISDECISQSCMQCLCWL